MVAPEQDRSPAVVHIVGSPYTMSKQTHGQQTCRRTAALWYFWITNDQRWIRVKLALELLDTTELLWTPGTESRVRKGKRPNS